MLLSSLTGPLSHRFKQEIMDEVLQEFLVTKTIQELENEKTDNVLFVGMYLTSDDKVSDALLMLLPHLFSLNFLTSLSYISFIFLCSFLSNTIRAPWTSTGRTTSAIKFSWWYATQKHWHSAKRASVPKRVVALTMYEFWRNHLTRLTRHCWHIATQQSYLTRWELCTLSWVALRQLYFILPIQRETSICPGFWKSKWHTGEQRIWQSEMNYVSKRAAAQLCYWTRRLCESIKVGYLIKAQYDGKFAKS